MANGPSFVFNVLEEMLSFAFANSSPARGSTRISSFASKKSPFCRLNTSLGVPISILSHNTENVGAFCATPFSVERNSRTTKPRSPTIFELVHCGSVLA